VSRPIEGLDSLGTVRTLRTSPWRANVGAWVWRRSARSAAAPFVRKRPAPSQRDVGTRAVEALDGPRHASPPHPPSGRRRAARKHPRPRDRAGIRNVAAPGTASPQIGDDPPKKPARCSSRTGLIIRPTRQLPLAVAKPAPCECLTAGAVQPLTLRVLDGQCRQPLTLRVLDGQCRQPLTLRVLDG
jgi:hypothetical protein